jgi:colicin import membrane protein
MSRVIDLRRERALSGGLAVAMHVLFFALLVVGVSWQKQIEPQAMVVDLWASLPAVKPAPVEPEPVAQPEPPPPPPPKVEAKPEPKPEPRPVAKPEAKPVPKADIALKEKQEKEKREKQERLEKEKKAKEDKLRAEKAKREQEDLQRKMLAAEQQKTDAAARAAKEQADAQRRAEAQAAAAQAKLVNEYTERIRAKVRGFVVLPPGLQGNPEAEFDVVLIPGGEILTTKLRKSSGNAAYDAAVERAILKAQPLPLPPDPNLFGQFRELRLKFRPQE